MAKFRIMRELRRAFLSALLGLASAGVLALALLFLSRAAFPFYISVPLKLLLIVCSLLPIIFIRKQPLGYLAGWLAGMWLLVSAHLVDLFDFVLFAAAAAALIQRFKEKAKQLLRRLVNFS